MDRADARKALKELPGQGLTRRLGANFYEAIRLALTVYKQTGDIDPAVAPREVLMALTWNRISPKR